jgi:hypothetical protein
MMPRVGVPAFADESVRDRFYLVSAALVAPIEVHRLRVAMRRLRMPGQRELHLKTEKVPRRRQLLDVVVGCGVQVSIYSAEHVKIGQEQARAACLHQLVVDLADRGAGRLVLDSRPGRDHLDARTIWAALGTRPGTVLRFGHADSASEPLIWVADLIGWAYGAGGEWRRRVAPAVICVNGCIP